MRADSMRSGARTNGWTVPPRDAMSRTSGGAATTSTTSVKRIRSAGGFGAKPPAFGIGLVAPFDLARHSVRRTLHHRVRVGLQHVDPVAVWFDVQVELDSRRVSECQCSR